MGEVIPCVVFPVTELDDREEGWEVTAARVVYDPVGLVCTAGPPIIVADNTRIDGHEGAM